MFSFLNRPDQDEYKDTCSSIIPGLIYLSGYRVANDLGKLEELEIRHIVRLGDEHDLALYATHPGIEYHTVEIKDTVRVHLTSAILNGAIDFILSATTPVLVHRRAGVSRSAAVAMAYLIKVHKRTYREAKVEVRGRRPCASPNTTFLKDVQSFDRALK